MRNVCLRNSSKLASLRESEKMPLVTALMTTYNASRWVEDTITSILNQTFDDFEFLIIDDASTDDTVETIRRFSDSRIKLIANSRNRGVGHCLNQALSFVKTPYVAKVDADDISVPTRFEEQLRFLVENEFDIVKSYLSYFADDAKVQVSERFNQFKNKKEVLLNDIRHPHDIEATLLDWPCFPHTTYFGKADLIKKVGYPSLRMFEDYVLFLRLLKGGYKFGCVEKVLVNMRVSNSSITASLSENALGEGLSCVVDEKWNRLSLGLQGKSLFVFGTGQMAKAFARIMIGRGVNVSGFVESSPIAETVNVGNDAFPILTLKLFLAKTNAFLVIAAQPVREEISTLLRERNLSNSHDFFVLA